MSKFEELKKEYANIQDKKLKLYEREREVLDLMQEHCPHVNTKMVDNSYIDLDFLDEEPYKKCSDCGKILK